MDKSELEQVLELQQKAYQLLLWIDAHAGAQPALLSEETVAALRHADSCRAWVEKMSGHFPSDLRVAAADLDAFSRLLSAFFSTSFRVEEKAHMISWNRETLSHTFEKRRHLVAGAAPSKSKKAREKDEASARNLQLIALEELAIDNDFDLSREQLEVLVPRADLKEAVVLWSYAHELARRARFASQGSAVHVLWRSMDPETRGKMTADDFWAARGRLLEAMAEAST